MIKQVKSVRLKIEFEKFEKFSFLIFRLLSSVELVSVKEDNNSINKWHPLSYCQQSCLFKSQGIQLAYQDCGGIE